MANFCTRCGANLRETDKFCPSCGAPVPTGRSEPDSNVKSSGENDRPESAPKPAGETKPKEPSAPPLSDPGQPPAEPGEHPILCPDGKYRWMYELHLLKDWSIFFLVWRIFFFILTGIFFVTAMVDACDWGFGEELLSALKMYLYFMIGMTVLVFIGYFVYAAIMGFKYCVIFELDETGVLHKQLPKQAKRSEVISLLTVLAGLASRNVTTVGVGMTSARTESYTEFDKVRKLRGSPRSGKIRLKMLLSKNEVYTAKEDYAFVWEYISSRCVNKK